MILPALMEVKRQEPSTGCEIIFIESKPYEDLCKSSFLFNEVTRIADRIDLIDKDARLTSDFFHKVIRTLKLLPCMVRMLASPRFILLHSRSLKSTYMKMLYFINRVMRGRTYEHFSGLSLTIGRLPDSKKSFFTEGDGFLCFGPHDRPFLEAMGKTKLFEIGYTRLYRHWLGRVRQVGPRYLIEELERLNMSKDRAIVGVFLGSTVPGVFEISELEVWLETAIKVVQRKIQEAVILLKPHPMQKMDHLNTYLAGMNCKGIAITHIHPTILAAGSKLIISHHSSTIIDGLSMKTPTIQYQDLTEHWMKRHPEGSAFLKLDPLWAQNEEELDKCIDIALSSQYVPPDIEGILGHREDISILLH